jgi:hypothetical protein
MGIGAYFRTTSHLRWPQLLWRIRYTLERLQHLKPGAISRWNCEHACPPDVRDEFPDLPLPPQPTIEAREATTVLRRGVFRHLNQSRHLGRERPNWLLGTAAKERLWTVALHYHAWAYQLAQAAAAGGDDADDAASLFQHYISDWIRHCAVGLPGARPLAWNSYAIATRIGWWVRSFRLLGRSRFQASSCFGQEFLRSLWQQAAFLRDHLEWDLRGNHLLRDAVGLAWAGRFFAGERARDWLAMATDLAVSQAREQVLHDGGHFERSPAYHLHVMEDVLSLHFLLEDPGTRLCLIDTWQRMAEYLAWLRHPDGGLARFNDGGINAADEPSRLLELGARLGVHVDSGPRRGGRYFPASGMVVWHGEPWSVFLDVGPLGPDYQPAHGHADTLSLECSYRGRRLFVDPGTYGYDNDDRRRYDRSTAAHNTVCIDNQDSSEVWHIFRVGSRAYPVNVSVEFTANEVNAIASHNGYDHLPGRPRHTRCLANRNAGPLTIIDRVAGRGNHRMKGGFLLAPEWSAAPTESGWILRNGSEVVRLTVSGPRRLALATERRAYHPEFGSEIKTTRVTWCTAGDLPVEVRLVALGAPE